MRIPSVVVHFLLILPLLSSVLSQQCYSCAGRCHSEHCNCQMGSCPASHCFIERTPTEESGVYSITKGCLRRPSRTLLGCDYDHFNDHVLCVCNGKYCNDHIFMRSLIRRNVTCRKCGERNSDCGETCQGQWCHEDSTTGASGCGFGPPSLPFFYKGPELLYFRNKLCITMTRGIGPTRKHCICNTNMCNSYRKYGSDNSVRSRSLLPQGVTTDPVLTLQECVSCEVTYTEDQASTPSCKSHRCMGHFCTLSAQRQWPTGGSVIGMSGGGSRPVTVFPLVTERQGCINVTDSTQMQFGCSHKWMDGNFEELLCACKGHLCNRDLQTASSHSVTQSLLLLLLLFFL